MNHRSPNRHDHLDALFSSPLIHDLAHDLGNLGPRRRRHPLAPQGLVADGIAAERTVTASLRVAADLTIDTSDLSLGGLRQTI